MAQISDWGPPLWKILHASAERAGAYSTEMRMVDEIRAWIRLLKTTEGVLPCPLCRNHYMEWRKAHPPEDLLRYRGSIFKEELRRWLWGLHEHVNTHRGIQPEARLSFEDLSGAYASVTRQEIQQSMGDLVKQFEKAVLYRQVQGTYVIEWKRVFAFLRTVVGGI